MLVVVLAACGEPGESRPDASLYNPMCSSVELAGSCRAGAATTAATVLGGAGSHSLCRFSYHSEVTCSACAVDAQVTATVAVGVRAEAPLWTVARRAEALCAETPEAIAGQPCNRSAVLYPEAPQAGPPTQPCLPTRAQLAADGTVISQNYLTCGPDDTCVAAAPPLVSRYLESCSSAAVEMPGVNGVADASCLLAWNDATATLHAGTTIPCIGDWECPSGALCDGGITNLTPSSPATPLAVCKPGPRGVLTPQMLLPR